MSIATEIKKEFDAHVISKKNGCNQEETYKKAKELGEEKQHFESTLPYSTFTFQDGSELEYDIFDLWTVTK